MGKEEIVPDEEMPVSELWKQIGFHKPLAGFWYNLTFTLISLFLGILLSGYLIKIFYPYPESNGYRDVTGGIFTLLFVVMDLGTHMTMERFIAEARIKSPDRMLHYIQYFIWYQAFTGLLQVSFVSVYALLIVPNTDLSYGVWLMLIVATYQYPGYLNVFNGVLNSLQQYNKTAVLGFITGQAFQRITELGFVYLGRMWGMANPAVGEIMGIAIGANIGIYVDDFFAMWLSAWFFSKAMKDEGIEVRDCFRIDFDWALVKEALIFGVKTGLPSLIGVGTGLIILMINVTYIPQYTTFNTLLSLIGGIAGMINFGGISAPTPLLAESYLNGKRKLTQFYIAQTWRYILLFQMLFVPIILSVYTVLEKFFIEFGMDNYLLAIPFFFPKLVRELQQPLTSFADSIQLGTNHPTFLMFLRLSEELLKVVFTALWVVWLALPDKYGIDALVWILPCGIYPAILFKTITAYIYIHKKIVPLKINKWQTFAVPLSSGAVMFVILYSFLRFIQPSLESLLGFLPSIIITIIFLLIVVLFGYLPVTALLGGWDTESLREFKQAAEMSGPSRWFVWPMYRLTEWGCKKSNLYNKYPIPHEDAIREARELLEIKNENAAENGVEEIQG